MNLIRNFFRPADLAFLACFVGAIAGVVYVAWNPPQPKERASAKFSLRVAR